MTILLQLPHGKVIITVVHTNKTIFKLQKLPYLSCIENVPLLSSKDISRFCIEFGMGPNVLLAKTIQKSESVQ